MITVEAVKPCMWGGCHFQPGERFEIGHEVLSGSTDT